jgi:hypothetical protein
MSKVSVIQRPDGGVSLCQIARKQRDDETDKDFLHAVTRRELSNLLAVAHGTAMSGEEFVAYLKQHDEAMTIESEAAKIGVVVVGILNSADIPTDRTFRNAWKDDNGIKVDMGKAKDLTKDRLRNERKPLLEAQDVAFQRALESGASTTEIVKEKQRLRDITKQVDALTSLDELKALSL